MGDVDGSSTTTTAGRERMNSLEQFSFRARIQACRRLTVCQQDVCADKRDLLEDDQISFIASQEGSRESDPLPLPTAQRSSYFAILAGLGA